MRICEICGTFKGKKVKEICVICEICVTFKGKNLWESVKSVGLLKVKESAGRLCQSEMRLGETVFE